MFKVHFDLSRLRKTLKEEMTLKNHPKIVEKILEDLRAATPVDTGHARDSWSATTLPSGKAHVTNTASYIQDLNAGTSEQAPARFIEQVLASYGKLVLPVVENKP